MSRKTVNITPKTEKVKRTGGSGCRRWAVWGGGAFVVLVVISAVFGDDPSPSTARGDEIELPTRVVADNPTPDPSPSTGRGDEVTVTVEASATITDTPAPTETATITDTPAPSATIAPEDVAMEIIAGEVVGGEVLSLTVNSFAVVSRFEMNNTFGYDVDYTHGQMVRMVCDLREVFAEHRIILDGVIYVVDGFGNESSQSGITITLEQGTVSQINCENEYNVNLPLIADSYDRDRLLDE